MSEARSGRNPGLPAVSSQARQALIVPDGVVLSEGDLAKEIVRQLSPAELQALDDWAGELLAIKMSGAGKMQQAARAVRTTFSARLLWPLLKTLARLIKKYGWDERSSALRAAGIFAGGAIALFGGQAAGIAAFGTAIGVPLWVIFGAGAGFPDLLRKEISGRYRA